MEALTNKGICLKLLGKSKGHSPTSTFLFCSVMFCSVLFCPHIESFLFFFAGFWTDHPTEASACIWKALSLSNTDPSVLNAAATLYREAQKFHEAVRKYFIVPLTSFFSLLVFNSSPDYYHPPLTQFTDSSSVDSTLQTSTPL